MDDKKCRALAGGKGSAFLVVHKTKATTIMQESIESINKKSEKSRNFILST
jgi:hypothetical protein